MNKKMIGKIIIDLMMTILLFILMAMQLTGVSTHEWIGTGMFLLWILHHILNRSWYRHLRKGNYTLFRKIQVILNVLLICSMIGTMVSAIILSREVFSFLPISGGIAFARSLHMLSAFWCFIFTSLHLGLHWNMILGMLKKVRKPISSKYLHTCIQIIKIFIVCYGIYAFMKNDFLSYLFLSSSFVYFDFERTIILYITEYAAIMGLFIFIGNQIQNYTIKRTTKD